jgi:hypothetical protein
VVIVAGQAKLFELVLTLHASGGLANLLHGWEKQSDQDGNDRDNDKEFNQREPPGPFR